MNKLRILYFTVTLFTTSNACCIPSSEELASQFRMLLQEKEATFVVANANPLYSLDPLDGLNLRNSRALQLLYTSPISMSKKGSYTSDILSHFSHDDSLHKTTLVLKKDARFHNGQKISPEDIALTIKRNILRHTRLPASSQIIGIAQWLKHKNPLKHHLAGILVDNSLRQIEILYRSKQKSALEKLSYTSFGVIPKSCVNLDTNKINCKTPPSSGKYYLSKAITKSGKALYHQTFYKFEKAATSKSLPDTIWLAYLSPSRIINYKDAYHDQVVIVANEIDIPKLQQQTLFKYLRPHRSVKNMYSFVLLNPKSQSFKEKRVRQYFMKIFRQVLKEDGISPEGSQMPPLVLGYLPLSSLERGIKAFSAKETFAIKQHLIKHPPVWMRANQYIVDPFSTVFNKTLKKLGIVAASESTQIYDGNYLKYWDQGLIAARPGHSTLGSIDPSADIKTIFTPGAHDFLNWLTNDPKLVALTNQLHDKDLETHLRLNRYLFEESKFAVTSNFSRIFLLSNAQNKTLPFRLREPEPWMFYDTSI